MATGVNEMLLQSHGGILRVFPATPERWSARFILRAQGSFLVGSEHRGRSGVPYIAIEPVGGAKRLCWVAFPWSTGATLTMDGRPVAVTAAKGVVTFDAVPGTVYVLTPRGSRVADVPMHAVGFKKQVAPCRLGNTWLGSRDGAMNHSKEFPLW
jgi:hypothetical protein